MLTKKKTFNSYFLHHFFLYLQVLDKCLPILPQVDRMAMLNANVIDLQWIAERAGGHWISGHVEGIIDVDYIIFSMNTYFEFSCFFFFHCVDRFGRRFNEIVNKHIKSKSNIVDICWRSMGYLFVWFYGT